MAIDAKMIKELREQTGMGISDCKKALMDANGNMEEAEMILRKKGIDKAAKKADRATGQGLIKIEVRGNDAIIMEVACEQEPTVKNERFVEFVNKAVELAFSCGATTAEELLAAKCGEGTLEEERVALIGVIGENVQLKKVGKVSAPEGGIIGQYTHFNLKAGAVCSLKLDGADAGNADLQTVANDVCMHAVAIRPAAVDRDGIPEDIIAKEREVFMEEVKSKPENIQEKIMQGKLDKFYKEKCLLEQVFVKDPDGKKTVTEVIAEAGKAAGGSAELVGFARFELGN